MGGFLQQLGQVRHIRHVPLTAPPAQDPLGHPAQLRRLQDGGHPTFAGVIGPLADRFGNRVGQ